MYLRVFISKFPNAMKAKLCLTYMQSTIPKLESESNLVRFRIMDIGEGKLLNVAEYKSKEDFEVANKWLGPMILQGVKELDGVIESITGDVIFSWERGINKTI